MSDNVLRLVCSLKPFPKSKEFIVTFIDIDNDAGQVVVYAYSKKQVQATFEQLIDESAHILDIELCQ